MSTLHADGSGWRAYVKGAPESVLPRCSGGPELAAAQATRASLGGAGHARAGGGTA